jgi:hypothetical protein
MANRNIKIRYLKSYDYKASLATGVYGGITANGMINANFFTDRTVLPDSQIIEVDENGVQIGLPKDQKDGDLLREVQFGALMDVNTAKVIVAWLDSKIEEYEKNFPNKDLK